MRGPRWQNGCKAFGVMVERLRKQQYLLEENQLDGMGRDRLKALIASETRISRKRRVPRGHWRLDTSLILWGLCKCGWARFNAESIKDLYLKWQLTQNVRLGR